MQGAGVASRDDLDGWMLGGTGAKFRGSGERDTYTPPCVSQRASGDLLCNAGSSVRCSVMTWMDGMWGGKAVGMGARFSREWREVYTHLWLSHVVV